MDLSKLLFFHHDKKVWILIDEYDAVVNKAILKFSDEDGERVLNIFRCIFQSALKGNEYLEKGIITGVQYMVKSGMLSGLNNLTKHDLTSPKYSKYYGVNQEEMSELLNHFKISTEKALQIKDWYNGYQENVGTIEEPIYIDKYNIWPVVQYLNNQYYGFKSYWGKSGSVDFMDILLKHPDFRSKIEDLVKGSSIVISKLTSDFSLANFQTLKKITLNSSIQEISPNGIDLIFSYLFITGYLTNTSIINKYKLPNNEI